MVACVEKTNLRSYRWCSIYGSCASPQLQLMDRRVQDVGHIIYPAVKKLIFAWLDAELYGLLNNVGVDLRTNNQK